jgi:predicted ATPase
MESFSRRRAHLPARLRAGSEAPLLLVLVLYGALAGHFVAFKGDVSRDLAAQILAIAEKQKASSPLMLGHECVGATLFLRGDFAEAKAHFDHGIALFDPAERRTLAMRFGEDRKIALLHWRSKALWILGYPEKALRDVDQALKDAREIDHAASLLWALSSSFFFVDTYCGNYATANVRVDELIALAHEKNSAHWKAAGMFGRGRLLGLAGRAADAVQMITSGINDWRSTGATFHLPTWLLYLAENHAELRQSDEAWRCIGEAAMLMEKTEERWFGTEVNRIAGEVELKSPQPDLAKAQAHFERALAVARQQQAKSWELRASLSLARLWRDQAKPEEARELLAPVYGWFTEGFDTRDLKEAKALPDELSS